MTGSDTERIRSSFESITASLASSPRPTRERVLSALAEHGPLPLTELARHVGVAKSTASELVASLAADGAVARVADATDRRRVVLTALAPAPPRPDPLAGALAVLPPSRLGAIADALEELAVAIAGTGPGGGARPGTSGPLLVVRLADTEVGIPLQAIVEVAETPPLRQVGAAIDGVAGVVALRGALVPAVDLAGLLGVEGGSRELCVVVETPTGPAALLAAEAVGIEHPERPLAPLPGPPAGAIAGALVLGDRIVLCLDVAGLGPGV